MLIITDSAADFTSEELEKYHVRSVATQVIFEDQTYTSGVDLPEDAFWARILNGDKVTTSQPAPTAFLEAFEEAKKANEEAVCICISSALSGTLQSARIAAEMIGYSGLHLVDSLCGAAAQKLLVLHACRLRDEGKLLAGEIAQKLEALRSRVRLFASLDTLDNLARSGRIPHIVASLGSITRLKPLLEVTRDGRIGLAGKAFGFHRAVSSLAKRVASIRIDAEHPVIPLYSYQKENCLALIEKLTALGVQVDQKLMTAIGPSIAPHIGPNAYGVTFIEAE